MNESMKDAVLWGVEQYFGEVASEDVLGCAASVVQELEKYLADNPLPGPEVPRTKKAMLESVADDIEKKCRWDPPPPANIAEFVRNWRPT